MKKYELIKHGCLYDFGMFINFKNARRHWARMYSGRYQIICCDEFDQSVKNVRLK